MLSGGHNFSYTQYLNVLFAEDNERPLKKKAKIAVKKKKITPLKNRQRNSTPLSARHQATSEKGRAKKKVACRRDIFSQLPFAHESDISSVEGNDGNSTPGHSVSRHRSTSLRSNGSDVMGKKVAINFSE